MEFTKEELFQLQLGLQSNISCYMIQRKKALESTNIKPEVQKQQVEFAESQIKNSQKLFDKIYKFSLTQE